MIERTKDYKGEVMEYQDNHSRKFKYTIKKRNLFGTTVKTVNNFPSELAAIRAMHNAITVLQGGHKYDPNA